MILHMSRGFVLGVLSTVFAVGGLTGYLLRGSPNGALSSAPALSRGAPVEPVVLPGPRPTVSRTTGVLKSAPTPGAYYRLGERETLSDVAKRAYGGTKRVPDLLAANPVLDPKRLSPGTLVYVPLGIEAVPMPPTDAPRPEPAKSAPAMSVPREPAPAPSLFAKPK